jgi:hypothetical protein
MSTRAATGGAAAPTVEESIRADWGWTPDLVLFIAAGVLSLCVIVFSIWLFRRAAAEECSK